MKESKASANRFACVSAKYIQNEEAGVTVAFCRFAHLDAKGKPDGLTFGSKGVARLAPGDVWDAEAGKGAAMAKAFRKALERILSKRKRMAEGMNAEVADCEALLKETRALRSSYADCLSDAERSLAKCEAAIPQYGKGKATA